jgi:hypothetical protein
MHDPKGVAAGAGTAAPKRRKGGALGERSGACVVVDDDGAVLIPAALLADVLKLAPEQERMEAWIMTEVLKGAVLPGLYPMNTETKARYQAES